MMDADNRLSRAVLWLMSWARMAPADEPKLASDSPPAPERRTGKPTPVDVDAAVVTLDAAAVRQSERDRIRAIVMHDLAARCPSLALKLATTTSCTVDAAIAALRSAPIEPRPSPHEWFHSAMQRYSPQVGAFNVSDTDAERHYRRT